MRLLLVFILSAIACQAQTTARGGNLRQGANTAETILTPTSVAAGKFGKVATCAVNGDVYAQPIILPSITISTVVHDVLIVPTMADAVYACDAYTGAALWNVSLGTARSSYPTVGGEQLYYGGTVGCVSTPVYDPVSGYLYVACTNSSPNWVLYQLNPVSGATVGSVTMVGVVPGSGDPTGGDLVSAGMLYFYPFYAFQRGALTLANGNIYIPFGSYDDAHPWHGWLFSVATSSLAINHVICITPNGYGGAVWYSGGPAVGGSGNLYVMTGNGDYDGTANFSESFLKLSPSLAILDSYTPSNWAALTAADDDLAAGPILVPGASLVVGGAKDHNVYSVSSSCMGGLGGTNNGCTAPQLIATGASILFASFLNTRAYVSNNAGTVYSYPLSGSTFGTVTNSVVTSASPGHAMSGSSNGASTGILWDVTVASTAFTTKQSATLRALDATTLTELWNSSTSGHDAPGNLAKYAPPTVYNGHVYLATASNAVVIYGISPSHVMGGTLGLSGAVSLQ